MEGKQIEPNVISYTTALNAFKEDSEEFRKVWNEMEGKQMEPDVISYNTPLNAFKEDSDEFGRVYFTSAMIFSLAESKPPRGVRSA